MSPRYAAATEVSSERSRIEIEGTLRRYGADQFMTGWDDRAALIEFRMRGKRIRFVLVLPEPSSTEFTLTPSRKQRRSEQDAMRAWEQAARQRWRALALVVKAKLEAVEAGISEFEEEFLSHIVLPDNRTVGEFLLPQVEQAYLHGHMPPLLPQLPGHADEPS